MQAKNIIDSKACISLQSVSCRVAKGLRAHLQGTSYGAPCELENVLAKIVIDRVPSIEMVRFVNSGTEACLSVLRLMRAYTKRDKVSGRCILPLLYDVSVFRQKDSMSRIEMVCFVNSGTEACLLVVHLMHAYTKREKGQWPVNSALSICISSIFWPVDFCEACSGVSAAMALCSLNAMTITSCSSGGHTMMMCSMFKLRCLLAGVGCTLVA